VTNQVTVRRAGTTAPPADLAESDASWALRAADVRRILSAGRTHFNEVAAFFIRRGGRPTAKVK
jgi:hypothetical protein